MNRNLVGSILGSSSINNAHLVSIRLQTWPPQTILISDWLISKKIFSSEAALPNEPKLGRKHPWKFLYKDAHLVSIRLQTWPPRTILVSDWLISKKSSPLKPLGQMNRNLVGSIYGRSCIKIAHFVPIRYQTWPPQTILISDWLISRKSSPL